ncbi:MAG: hypothetical protein IJ867_05245 [Clostridia bacterium]|nr:hypothetical protein [Clostridia bacterium]
MEFTNEIFFNKPLTAGSTVIITYSGQLYREHSKDVSIVYGYGENWAETDNTPMVETENGFEVTLNIKNYNTLNFCFTNSFNIWDNNSGFNYIAPIAPKQDKETKEENASTSTPVQEETEETEENEVQEEQAEPENTANFEEQQDVETAFASLLDSILDEENNRNETIDISNLSGFGLQSVDEIKEEDMINCDNIFAELFEELTTDSQASTPITESGEQKPEITNYAEYEAQELDTLMDNLLMSIAGGSDTAESATPIQTIESQDLSNEVVGLPDTIEKEDWVDKIVNISYNFSKKVTTAFKKFGALVKLKAKEFGLISEDK